MLKLSRKLNWNFIKQYMKDNRVAVYKALIGGLVSFIPITNKIPAEAHPFVTKVISSTLRNCIDWLESKPSKSEQFGFAASATALIVAVIAATTFMPSISFYVTLGRIVSVSTFIFGFFNASLAFKEILPEPIT